MDEFHGAKAAVFIGNQLLVCLRDDIPTIPYPNCWDFPGGGRERAERPEETLFREIHEEFGLTCHKGQIRWKRKFPINHIANKTMWVFVLHLPIGAEQHIRFGSEGQRWDIMTWREFESLPNVVPSYRERMKAWARSDADAHVFLGAQPS